MRVCVEVVHRSFDYDRWQPVNKWVRKYYLAADIASPIWEEEIPPSPNEAGVRRYVDAAAVAASNVEALSSRTGEQPYSGWNEGERVCALLEVEGKKIPVQVTRWVGQGLFAGRNSLVVRPVAEAEIPPLTEGSSLPSWLAD